MIFTERDLQMLNPDMVDYYFDEFDGTEYPRYQFGRVEVDLDGWWYLDGEMIDEIDSLHELNALIEKYRILDSFK